MVSELMDGKQYRRRDGRILEAVIALADADADDDRAYHAAWARFFKTLNQLGWKQPPRCRCRPGPAMVTEQLPLPWRRGRQQ
jgi:hypothetical protein